MRLDKVWVLVRREYLERVRTKAFWISTVAVPLLFAAFAILPAVVMSQSTSHHRLVLVDQTGRLAAPIVEQLGGDDGGGGGGGGQRSDAGMVRFEVTVEEPAADATDSAALAAQQAELGRRVLDEELDAWLWIGADALTDNRVEYHAESVSNFLTQEMLEDVVSREVRRLRLAEAGLDVDEVAELTRSVDITTVRVTAEGGQAEGGFAGAAVAYVLFFMLYLVIVIYGQQVMNGVIEEKTSRAVEVMISSVKPFELMMGKLLGIGLVGLTQLGVWLGSMVVITAPAILGSLAALPEEFGAVRLPPSLALHFVVCFVLGYFLYASVYAAIGSAFNNVQEAQQFASIAVMLLVAPIVLFVPVLNDPDATWAVVASMIPLFTPLLMLLRIAVKEPPAWQIAVGYLGTGLAVGAVLWLAGRIYRVGILMYGKKPTLKEIARWVRYA